MRLVRAAKSGNETRHYMRDIKEALAQNADIDGCDPEEPTTYLQGFSALHFAALNGDAELARFLLRRRADVNRLCAAKGETPLHQAAGVGSTEVISILLDHGAFVDSASKWHWTPLHWATRHDHAACVKLLLDKAANASLSAKPWRGESMRLLKHFPGLNFNPMEFAVMRRSDASLAIFRERKLLPDHLSAYKEGGEEPRRRLSAKVEGNKLVLEIAEEEEEEGPEEEREREEKEEEREEEEEGREEED
jgi:hypothetical protein